MSKALSTQATLARGRRWHEIVRLLELTLYRDRFGPSPSQIRLRLSDASRRELGQEWVGCVADWGNIGDALSAVDPAATVGTLDVTLRNHVSIGGRARFTDLIRHGTNGTGYDQAFGDATLYIVFKGGALGDEVKLFALMTEEVTNIGGVESCVLRLSGRELASEDRDGLLRVTTDRFPFASPTAVGQPIPHVYGVIKQLPVLWAVAGLTDKLRADMTVQFPLNGGVIFGSSPDVAARLVAGGASAGRIQIDGEQIQYTSIDVANAAFQGCTRGVNGTQVGGHQIGATIVQVVSKFIAICWENRPDYTGQAITGVYFRDGTFKLATTLPRHQIVLQDLTTWPGKNLCTVHFEGVDAVTVTV